MEGKGRSDGRSDGNREAAATVVAEAAAAVKEGTVKEGAVVGKGEKAEKSNATSDEESEREGERAPTRSSSAAKA